MKKAIIALALVLTTTGCKEQLNLGLARPPIPPELPKELNEERKALPPILDNSQNNLIVELSKTQQAYNETAYEKNAVVKIYNCVRETLADRKKNVERCLNEF